MKILKLHVQGFRSLKSVDWDLIGLNVLTGPNNSGKTNLVRSIALLNAAATGKLSDTILGYGGIAPLLWDGRASYLDWKVQFDTAGLLDYPSVPKASDKLTYELRLERFGPLNSFRIEHELLADYGQMQARGAKEPFKLIERDPKHAVIFDSQERRLTAPADKIDDNVPLLSAVSRILSSPRLWSFHRSIASWGIYHDLLVYEGSPVRQATVTRRDTHLDSDGQNLVAVLHTLYTTDRDFKQQLNDSMKAAFGRDFEGLEFPPAEDQRVQMRITWRSLKTAQPATDCSDGTLRFLMLIAILANPNRGDVVIIEEPETNLHPAMFPVIADLAGAAAVHSQVIFTTHSPQFLTALAEKKPNTTVMQFSNGETSLRVLK